MIATLSSFNEIQYQNWLLKSVQITGDIAIIGEIDFQSSERVAFVFKYLNIHSCLSPSQAGYNVYMYLALLC